MTKPITKTAIQEFINLLRNPITGYDYDYEHDGPNGNDSKVRFHKLGQKLLKEIATRLQLPTSAVSWNPGGPAVSGDHHLEGRGLYLTLGQTSLGFDFGFMYRYGTKRFCTDGANQWMPWSALLNLDVLCAELQSHLTQNNLTTSQNVVS